jgi:hypothetical protein
VIYSNGEGGSEDFAEAAANYRRAAEHGHAAAAGALAFMYFSGHGVEKNPAEAVKWLEAAESRAAPEDRWMYLLWREYVSSAISRR